MPGNNRFLDDLARVASGAANALSGIKTETEAVVRQQVEHFLAGMNLVRREEFEVVQAMAAKARDQQEAMAAALAALEARLALLEHPPRRPKKSDDAPPT